MFKEQVREIEQEVIGWRRDLHQIPELGNELPQTSAYICGVLTELGIPFERGIGIEFGILGEIDSGKPGKTVALRADMDALKVIEETSLDFASTNGCMHACGHDGHSSILLGVAKILNENKDAFTGRVRLLFQPGEEIAAGAKPMVEAGVLEGVDYILGLHIGNISEELKPGMVMLSTGPMMACLDNFQMKVKGVGAHGAYPHQGIDPVVVTSHIIIGLQEIISRELNPVEPGVITIGQFTSGSAYNIIPDYAELQGTARAMTNETRQYLARRIGEVAEGIARGFRCEVEYNYNFAAPPVINDEEVAHKVVASARKIMDHEMVQYLKNPTMIGEDFSYYLERVPGAFIFLGNPLPIDGVIYPHHNSKFALDEGEFKTGIELLTQATVDLLNE